MPTHRSPGARATPPVMLLLPAVIACIAVCLGTVWIATQRPWLGLHVGADLAVRGEGPAAHLPAGELRSVQVTADAPPVILEASDLVEDVDAFDIWPALVRFYERQDRLVPRAGSPVVLSVATPAGIVGARVEPAPRRPLGTLPFLFWFDVLIGAIASLLGAWIWALRPRERSVQLFAALGVGLLGFAVPAAVYGTRELALPSALFRALSTLNLFGAVGFGIGLVGLFAVYPQRLVPDRVLLLVPVVFCAWALGWPLRLGPSPLGTSQLVTVAQMALALVLGVVQWRRSRGAPEARARLRFFGSAVLLGAMLFIGSVPVAQLLGLPSPPEGYAYGFFLFVDVGLALGLRHGRLFELDEWAYRLLLWIAGAVLLLGLDAGLVLVLRFGMGNALALALVATGLVYLPARTWLWERLVLRRRVDEAELFAQVVEIAFAVSDAQRRERWLALLGRLFDPLEVSTVAGEAEGAVRIEEGGIALVVPGPVSSAPAVRLAFPWRGRGLFGARQAALARQLAELLRRAEASREAYDRGAREERGRIARDLHDDMGARLLSGLRRPSIEDTRESIRAAMADMREIVRALSTPAPGPLLDVLAELRHETQERLAAAGIGCRWAPLEVDPALTLAGSTSRQLGSIVREAVTNVIKHARATEARVELSLTPRSLALEIADDGVGFDPASVEQGHGLRHLAARVGAVGGSVRWAREDAATRVLVEVPLAGPEAPA